jgi:hypothetical protein
MTSVSMWMLVLASAILAYCVAADTSLLRVRPGDDMGWANRHHRTIFGAHRPA